MRGIGSGGCEMLGDAIVGLCGCVLASFGYTRCWFVHLWALGGGRGIDTLWHYQRLCLLWISTCSPSYPTASFRLDDRGLLMVLVTS